MSHGNESRRDVPHPEGVDVGSRPGLACGSQRVIIAHSAVARLHHKNGADGADGTATGRAAYMVPCTVATRRGSILCGTSPVWVSCERCA